MSRWFWALLAVNAALTVLLFFALPWGPDLIYLAQAGSLLGAVFLLGWRERETLSVPPPSHPVHRNPRAPR